MHALKNKFLSIGFVLTCLLLTICLSVGLIPSPAFAEMRDRFYSTNSQESSENDQESSENYYISDSLKNPIVSVCSYLGTIQSDIEVSINNLLYGNLIDISPTPNNDAISTINYRSTESQNSTPSPSNDNTEYNDTIQQDDDITYSVNLQQTQQVFPYSLDILGITNSIRNSFNNLINLFTSNTVNDNSSILSVDALPLFSFVSSPTDIEDTPSSDEYSEVPQPIVPYPETGESDESDEDGSFPPMDEETLDELFASFDENFISDPRVELYDNDDDDVFELSDGSTDGEEDSTDGEEDFEGLSEQVTGFYESLTNLVSFYTNEQEPAMTELKESIEEELKTYPDNTLFDGTEIDKIAIEIASYYSKKAGGFYEEMDGVEEEDDDTSSEYFEDPNYFDSELDGSQSTDQLFVDGSNTDEIYVKNHEELFYALLGYPDKTICLVDDIYFPLDFLYNNEPIASFSGCLDGCGYTIEFESANAIDDMQDNESLYKKMAFNGLFRCIDGGSVVNLSIVRDLSILDYYSEALPDKGNIGILANNIKGSDVKIENVQILGDLSVIDNKKVSYFGLTSTQSDSYESMMSFNAAQLGALAFAGGITGAGVAAALQWMGKAMAIAGAAGTIDAAVDTAVHKWSYSLGSIAGKVLDETQNLSISNCHLVGSVTCDSRGENKTGGFVGLCETPSISFDGCSTSETSSVKSSGMNSVSWEIAHFWSSFVFNLLFFKGVEKFYRWGISKELWKGERLKNYMKKQYLKNDNGKSKDFLDEIKNKGGDVRYNPNSDNFQLEYDISEKSNSADNDRYKPLYEQERADYYKSNDPIPKIENDININNIENDEIPGSGKAEGEYDNRENGNIENGNIENGNIEVPDANNYLWDINRDVYKLYWDTKTNTLKYKDAPRLHGDTQAAYVQDAKQIYDYFKEQSKSSPDISLESLLDISEEKVDNADLQTCKDICNWYKGFIDINSDVMSFQQVDKYIAPKPKASPTVSDAKNILNWIDSLPGSFKAKYKIPYFTEEVRNNLNAYFTYVTDWYAGLCNGKFQGVSADFAEKVYIGDYDNQKALPLSDDTCILHFEFSDGYGYKIIAENQSNPSGQFGIDNSSSSISSSINSINNADPNENSIPDVNERIKNSRKSNADNSENKTYIDKNGIIGEKDPVFDDVVSEINNKGDNSEEGSGENEPENYKNNIMVEKSGNENSDNNQNKINEGPVQDPSVSDRYVISAKSKKGLSELLKGEGITRKYNINGFTEDKIYSGKEAKTLKDMGDNIYGQTAIEKFTTEFVNEKCDAHELNEGTYNTALNKLESIENGNRRILETFAKELFAKTDKVTSAIKKYINDFNKGRGEARIEERDAYWNGSRVWGDIEPAIDKFVKSIVNKKLVNNDGLDTFKIPELSVLGDQDTYESTRSNKVVKTNPYQLLIDDWGNEKLPAWTDMIKAKLDLALWKEANQDGLNKAYREYSGSWIRRSNYQPNLGDIIFQNDFIERNGDDVGARMFEKSLFMKKADYSKYKDVLKYSNENISYEILKEVFKGSNEYKFNYSNTLKEDYAIDKYFTINKNKGVDVGDYKNFNKVINKKITQVLIDQVKTQFADNGGIDYLVNYSDDAILELLRLKNDSKIKTKSEPDLFNKLNSINTSPIYNQKMYLDDASVRQLVAEILNGKKKYYSANCG